jgi:mannitol 2-dehydrogenase
MGRDEQGQETAIVDPLADILIQNAQQGKTDPRPLLSITEVFGSDLP